MQDFVSLAIVGAAVSALVQFIKRQTYVSPRVAVIVLSAVAGSAYWYLQDTALWEAVLGILLIANGVYGLIISQFEA